MQAVLSLLAAHKLFSRFHVESYLGIFSILLSIVITSVGEERAGLYVSRAFVYGYAAARGCGTPWIFLVTNMHT